MKDKYSIHSSQDISSSLVSTELDPTVQSEGEITKYDWGNMVTAQKMLYLKNKEDTLIIIKNDKMRRHKIYLRKELNTIKLKIKTNKTKLKHLIKTVINYHK